METRKWTGGFPTTVVFQKPSISSHACWREAIWTFQPAGRFQSSSFCLDGPWMGDASRLGRLGGAVPAASERRETGHPPADVAACVAGGKVAHFDVGVFFGGGTLFSLVHMDAIWKRTICWRVYHGYDWLVPWPEHLARCTCRKPRLSGESPSQKCVRVLGLILRGAQFKIGHQPSRSLVSDLVGSWTPGSWEHSPSQPCAYFPCSRHAASCLFSFTRLDGGPNDAGLFFWAAAFSLRLGFCGSHGS